MKKSNCIVLITLCLLICFAISACNNVTVPNATNPTAQSNKDEDSTANTPGVTMTFGSVTDIVKFVSAANSQETQFSEYKEKHSISKNITYDIARNFASNCRTTKVFCNKSDTICDSFSGTYYAERNELSIIYKIESIVYRFIYTFGADSPHQYDGEPVFRDVSVGSFEFDLYQGDGCLVGSVIDGTTTIRIIVKSKQINDINFDAFTIIDLPKQYQAE